MYIFAMLLIGTGAFLMLYTAIEQALFAGALSEKLAKKAFRENETVVR